MNIPIEKVPRYVDEVTDEIVALIAQELQADMNKTLAFCLPGCLGDQAYSMTLGDSLSQEVEEWLNNNLPERPKAKADPGICERCEEEKTIWDEDLIEVRLLEAAHCDLSEWICERHFQQEMEYRRGFNAGRCSDNLDLPSSSICLWEDLPINDSLNG